MTGLSMEVVLLLYGGFEKAAIDRSTHLPATNLLAARRLAAFAAINRSEGLNRS